MFWKYDYCCSLCLAIYYFYFYKSIFISIKYISILQIIIMREIITNNIFSNWKFFKILHLLSFIFCRSFSLFSQIVKQRSLDSWKNAFSKESLAFMRCFRFILEGSSINWHVSSLLLSISTKFTADELWKQIRILFQYSYPDITVDWTQS